jgi:hypothetical protein
MEIAISLHSDNVEENVTAHALFFGLKNMLKSTLKLVHAF